MTPPAPSLRDTNLDKLGTLRFDVLVLGGGINGAVSAAALATRGAKVALIDRGDFASVTSQQSSNLAWGGIKYLETYEFGLVRKLCRARNRLLRAYPSTVQEIRFFTSVARGASSTRTHTCTTTTRGSCGGSSALPWTTAAWRPTTSRRSARSAPRRA